MQIEEGMMGLPRNLHFNSAVAGSPAPILFTLPEQLRFIFSALLCFKCDSVLRSTARQNVHVLHQPQGIPRGANGKWEGVRSPVLSELKKTQKEIGLEFKSNDY